MPVSIPYTWTQTAESLELRADIRTGNVSKDTMHIEGQRPHRKQAEEESYRMQYVLTMCISFLRATVSSLLSSLECLLCI